MKRKFLVVVLFVAAAGCEAVIDDYRVDNGGTGAANNGSACSGNVDCVGTCCGGICASSCDVSSSGGSSSGGSSSSGTSSSGVSMNCTPASGDSACMACAKQNCCSPLNKCVQDQACMLCLEQTEITSTSPCLAADANANAMYVCEIMSCMSACGTGIDGGSSSGSSGGGSGSPVPDGDPCVQAPGLNPGNWWNYCGANLSATADPNTLYTCYNGATAFTIPCSNGCNATYDADYDCCIGVDPCASGVDGWWCGSNLSPSADQNTLYDCLHQQTVSTVSCSGTCVAMPPGQADYCQ